MDITDPSPEEIDYLNKKFSIPKEFVENCLDPAEISRADKHDGISMFIFRVPCMDKNGKLGVIPLGVVIADDAIITISSRETEVVKDFYDGRVKASTKEKANMLLQILKRSNHHYIRYLEGIEKEIDVLEKSLVKSFRNEEIKKLLMIQKELIYVDTGVVSNATVLDEILDGDTIELSSNDSVLLHHVINENRQTMQMGKIFSSILSNTMDAYASIISNNLNMVMKFLTSITIILAVPAMVGTFYGMNIELPLQRDPNAFLEVTAVATGFTALLVYIFLKKKWF